MLVNFTIAILKLKNSMVHFGMLNNYILNGMILIFVFGMQIFIDIGTSQNEKSQSDNEKSQSENEKKNLKVRRTPLQYALAPPSRVDGVD